jgi:hypothetical protein
LPLSNRATSSAWNINPNVETEIKKKWLLSIEVLSRFRKPWLIQRILLKSQTDNSWYYSRARRTTASDTNEYVDSVRGTPSSLGRKSCRWRPLWPTWIRQDRWWFVELPWSRDQACSFGPCWLLLDGHCQKLWTTPLTIRWGFHRF